jgi:hypothetical protein
MAKKPEKCCKTCKWARFPRTANRRFNGGWVGECLWPTPVLAASLAKTTHFRKWAISLEFGTDCETYEEGTPQ